MAEKSKISGSLFKTPLNGTSGNIVINVNNVFTNTFGDSNAEFSHSSSAESEITETVSNDDIEIYKLKDKVSPALIISHAVAI